MKKVSLDYLVEDYFIDKYFESEHINNNFIDESLFKRFVGWCFG